MRKGSSKEWPLIDAFGICRQTVLPLYLRPSIDSALVTQLLFGECYQLRGLTSDRQWFQAFHEDTGVEGWVWANSIKEITAADYQVFLNQDFQVVTSPIAAISYQGASVYLLPGSRLHFSEKELFNCITFSLPNKVEEKVISIRTNGDNQGTSPAPYIQTSFYQDKINEVVSPLSKSAFIYYQFTFQGSFFDQDLLINKIKVTPRSRGEKVFEGYIYIIDDLWAIHSLDLKTSVLGFQIHAKQQYAPVADKVWMPVTQR